MAGNNWMRTASVLTVQSEFVKVPTSGGLGWTTKEIEWRRSAHVYSTVKLGTEGWEWEIWVGGILVDGARTKTEAAAKSRVMKFVRAHALDQRPKGLVLYDPRARWTLDGEPVEIEGFLKDNAEGLVPEEVARILALQPGQSLTLGGGAWAEFTLARGGGR